MASRSKVYLTSVLLVTNECPFPGITGGYGGDRRVEHIVPPKAVCDGHYSVVIESSCNGMFGVPWNGDTIAPPDVNLLCLQYNIDTDFI
jgi:alpha-mannosidase